jgi:hypothetical protein
MRLSILIISAILLFSSCKKEEDRTTQVLGEFIGNYFEEQPGASIILEDVTAKITKKDNNSVNIEILPNNISVTMVGEISSLPTNFFIPEFEFMGVKLTGNGSFTNDLLFIAFDDGERFIDYRGRLK